MDEFTNNLSNEERETHISMTGDNRKEWIVFSDDPVWIRKLDKLATGIDVGKGREYRLQANQVSLRNPRKLSEEQRQALAERLNLMRTAKSARKDAAPAES